MTQEDVQLFIRSKTDILYLNIICIRQNKRYYAENTNYIFKHDVQILHTFPQK